MGFKVGILDADIYGPSIPIMFDVQNEKPLAVNVDGKSKMKPVESYGVKILSIGFFTKSDQAVVWRGPMASKALNQMIFDAAWGELDFLLIDLPPGTGDIHLSIMQSLPITGACRGKYSTNGGTCRCQKRRCHVSTRKYQCARFRNH